MQIDYAVLGTFTVLWLAIVPTPGPNTLLIVHLALTAGWRDVGLALVGNLLAIASYALATLFGLALLLAAAPSVRLAIYLLGGAYLVWVGVRLVRAGLMRRKSGAAAGSNAGLGDAGLGDGAQKPFLRGDPDGPVERAGAVLSRQHLRRRRHPGRQSGHAGRRRRRHRRGQRRVSHAVGLAAAAPRPACVLRPQPRQHGDRIRCAVPGVRRAPRAARAGGVAASATPPLVSGCSEEGRPLRSGLPRTRWPHP